MEDLFSIEEEVRTDSAQALERDVLRLAFFESPLGDLAAVMDEGRICWLSFTDGEQEGVREFAQRRMGQDVAMARESAHDVLESELDEYFRGTRTEFSVAG